MCSTETNKQRIINFGENPERVKNFGYIGIDTLFKSKLLSRQNIMNKLNVSFNKKNLILTFHPETFKTEDQNKKKALLIINTLVKYKDINFFITSLKKYVENIKILFTLNHLVKNIIILY